MEYISESTELAKKGQKKHSFRIQKWLTLLVLTVLL